MPFPDPLWLLAAFAGGLVAGSFLNVLVARLPIMLLEDSPRLDLWAPRSHCPYCQETLRARHLVPLLSYMGLRGRCAFCRVPISPRYPLLELAAGLLGIIALARMDSWAQAGAAATLGWGLLALALIDWEVRLLPDLIVYPLLWLGLLVNVTGLFTPLADAVIGAAAGYLALWLLHHAWRLMHDTPGMGYGDFKLFAVCGAWAGWIALPWIALAAALLALALALLLRLRGYDEQTLPFGSALALALFAFLLWREPAYVLLGP